MGGQAFEAERLSGGFKFDPDELFIVGLDEPYEACGPEHPLWDPRAKDPVDQRMVDSLITQGFIQPVRIIKDESGDPLVVVGRGRVKAAREANVQLHGSGRAKLLVPAIIMVKGTTGFELSMAKLAENQLRRPDTALGLADKAAAALKLSGDDTPAARKALAISLGLTTQRLTNLLLLRQADPVVVKAAKDGNVGVEQAIALAKMPVAEQAPALEKVRAEGLTVEQTREHTRNVKAVKAHENGDTGKDAPRFPPPTKATVRRVLADKGGKEILMEERGDRVARWILGDLAPTQIKGLLAVMQGD